MVYLPSYSPDFNLIENAGSKVKAYLRAAEARTYEDLDHEIIQALASITTQDLIGYYTHCRYYIANPELDDYHTAN